MQRTANIVIKPGFINMRNHHDFRQKQSDRQFITSQLAIITQHNAPTFERIPQSRIPFVHKGIATKVFLGKFG